MSSSSAATSAVDHRWRRVALSGGALLLPLLLWMSRDHAGNGAAGSDAPGGGRHTPARGLHEFEVYLLRGKRA